MLNGIDPIIVFNFKKIVPGVDSGGSIPIAAEVAQMFTLPAIPIYLSERLTGIYIDTESKSIEIQTETDTLKDGKTPKNNQKGISNTVRIEMVARRGAIGAALFAALADLVFPKLTSSEYSVTYLHGAITVFGGLIGGFSMNQEANTDLYKISLSLEKPAAVTTAAIAEETAVVPRVAGVTP
jgi:hypothetical protein